MRATSRQRGRKVQIEIKFPPIEPSHISKNQRDLIDMLDEYKGVDEIKSQLMRISYPDAIIEQLKIRVPESFERKSFRNDGIDYSKRRKPKIKRGLD